jgi:hypothetical protein
LVKLGAAFEPAAQRAALNEAIGILDTLASAGKLPDSLAVWPDVLRGLLAKVPPETASE